MIGPVKESVYISRRTSDFALTFKFNSLILCLVHEKLNVSVRLNFRLFLSTHYRSTSTSANPAKRLWYTLVHKEELQEIFLEFVFGRGDQPIVKVRDNVM